METELILKSRAYAEDILRKLPKTFTYHNLKHTTEVAQAAEEIGKQSNLSVDDLENVIIAAWLHDTGYEKDLQHHEERSAKTATELLQNWGAPAEKIRKVQELIGATRMPQNPRNLPEQVLCDADMYHLSKKDVLECSQQIREEFETFKNLKFESDKEWGEYNLKFFKSHSYFTLYGRQVLEERKKKNIKKLKKMLNPKVDEDYVKDLEGTWQASEKARQKSKSRSRN